MLANNEFTTNYLQLLFSVIVTLQKVRILSCNLISFDFQFFLNHILKIMVFIHQEDDAIFAEF